MEIDDGNNNINNNHLLSISESLLKEILYENNSNLEKLILSNEKNQNKKLQFPTNYIKEDIIEKETNKFSQYNSLYISRFNQTKNNLKQNSKIKWPNIKICDNILDLKGNEEQIIIGITYKEMPLKPSILKGVENMLGIKKKESFVKIDEDFLLLEDNSGRIRINSQLSENINIGEYISGIPLSFKGFLDDKGLFIVNDVLFYTPEIKIIKNTNNDINDDNNKNLILFISSLEIGHPNEKNGKSILGRNTLLHFIQNLNNLNEKTYNISNKISRIIICGNSIYSPDDSEQVEKGSYIKQELNTRIYEIILNNYEKLDEYIEKISNYISIDIIPGNEDINGDYFPQNGIDKILFEKNKNTIDKTLFLVSDPYSFYINNTHFLGTSGYNINSIKQITTFNNNLDIMEKILLWSHLSPNAPDTLRIFPYQNYDPLLLDFVPDVFFCGGKKFEYRKKNFRGKDILFISLPSFREMLSGVIYNVDNGNVMEINFNFFN